jgi:hypothetical protein
MSPQIYVKDRVLRVAVAFGKMRGLRCSEKSYIDVVLLARCHNRAGLRRSNGHHAT